MKKDPLNSTIDLTRREDFAIGPLQVQPRRKQLVNGDHVIELEPRVMQVLIALHDAAPDAASRDELLARCWSGVVVGDDAVQRCIGSLRKALLDMPSVIIKTISRVGYQLIVEPTTREFGSPERAPARNLSELPVLGVHTFSCKTGAPSDTLFAELLSDDIASALTVHEDLQVVDLSQSSTLLPEFELSGDTRRQGESTKITLRLKETDTQRLLWNYALEINRGSNELPNDDLVIDVSGRVANELMNQVTQRVMHNAQERSAWAYVIRANASYQRIDLANLQIAAEHAKNALKLQPDYGAAHAALANSLAASYELQGGAFGAQTELAIQAREYCDQAMSLDQNNATVLAWVANALGMITRPAQGMLVIERAIELNPAHHIAHLYKSRHHLYRQEPDVALACLAEHERVAPRFPWTYWVTYLKAVAHFMQGDLETADQLIDQSSIMNPAYPYVYIGKMVTAGALGHTEEATLAAQKLQRLEGEQSLPLQQARVQHSYANSGNVKSLLELLEKSWQLG